MDVAVRAWLASQLGAKTDLADLGQRYFRLGSARAVALEILYERKAKLIHEQPATVNVSSVVAVTYTENIKAIERQITSLEAGIPLAPDESDPDGDGTAKDSSISMIQLIERPRR